MMMKELILKSHKIKEVKPIGELMKIFFNNNIIMGNLLKLWNKKHAK